MTKELQELKVGNVLLKVDKVYNHIAGPKKIVSIHIAPHAKEFVIWEDDFGKGKCLASMFVSNLDKSKKKG